MTRIYCLQLGVTWAASLPGRGAPVGLMVRGQSRGLLADLADGYLDMTSKIAKEP